jgi:trk system potassium uptake protein TrkH
MFSLLLGKQITLKDRLLIQEATKSFTTQGMVKLAIHIILITFILEIIVAAILAIHWSAIYNWKIAIYQAVFYSISAFNNSGMSLSSNSLRAYLGNPLVNICITSLSLIGGIGFTVLLDIYHNRRWKKLSLHSKLVLLTSGILLLVGFIIILSLETYNPATLGQLTWGKRIWAAWFQTVSPRSSGFYTITTSTLLPSTLLLMILLMFIGSGPGSTGGGIKLSTFSVVVMAIVNLFKGNKDVNILKRRLNSQLVTNAIAIAILAVSIIFLITFCLIVSENNIHQPAIAIFFEVVSAFGTAGLSMGITPMLSDLGKCLLVVTMFIGKIGPLTIVFALAAGTMEKRIRYPEDRVLIG